MKFSYSWLKDYVSDTPSKDEVVNDLNLYSFEAVDGGSDIIDVSLQPNRYADASSHWGLAREVAAAHNLTLTLPDVASIPQKKGWFPIEIENLDACSRYCGVFVDGVSVSDSPDWIRERLETCGIRPINNIVDVMNYVMLETGQPLHAFDADKIGAGDKEGSQKKRGIYIRNAEKDEKMTTLDNNTFTLQEDILVIADNIGPLAIAGIKGGKRAEVTAHTTRIVIESAYFDPISIYKTARDLPLRTDASDRFSHTMAPALCPVAASRAAHLLQEIGAATTIIGMIDAGDTKITPVTIDIEYAWLDAFLGATIERNEIKRILDSLSFTISHESNTEMRVTAPDFRSDIAHKADIAEEIVRMYGFNAIPATAPAIVPQPVHNEYDRLIDLIRSTLVSFGISETYNYSFVSQKEAGADDRYRAIEMLNPISEQYQYLRTSLFPHLLTNTANNFRFFDSVRFFEVGNVYEATGDKDVTRERTMAGIIISHKKSDPKELFYEIKGVVDELMRRLGVMAFSFREPEKTPSFLIPGKTAELVVDDGIVGHLGIAGTHVGDSTAAFAELHLGWLTHLLEAEREYSAIPTHPAIERDISLYVKPETRVADTLNIIYNAGATYIENVNLLDIYEDKEKGRKSFAFRIVFRAPDRTLSDDEATKEVESIITDLRNKLGAEIR